MDRLIDGQVQTLHDDNEAWIENWGPVNMGPCAGRTPIDPGLPIEQLRHCVSGLSSSFSLDEQGVDSHFFKKTNTLAIVESSHNIV